MRIFILDTYVYGAVLENFYQNFDVKNKTYSEVMSGIFSLEFGTSNFYSKNLNKLGHVSQEFIFNDLISQSIWAKENGINLFFDKLRKKDWKEKILLAQIKKFEPDVVYSQDLWVINPKFAKEIKKHTKLLVGQIASPMPPVENIKSFDLILTSLPHFVDKFKSQGVKSEYFRIGFEESLLSKLGKKTHKYDVSFIGGFGPMHKKGITALESLAKEVSVDFWGYGEDGLPSDSAILKSFHGFSIGLDNYKILNASKIGINRHIDVAEDYANNMRLFETTGVGAMLITDSKKNIGDLFVPGKEIETYSSPKELITKVKYYLKHDKEREKIAKAGQMRTLKDHTYFRRMEELAEILERNLVVNLKDSWQDPGIPEKQWETVSKELENINTVPPFKSLVELIKPLDLSEKSKVLEIGCSSGYYSEVLKKSDINVSYEGCDYSEPFINFAKEKFPKIPFRVADATNLPYKDKEFILVISGGCILHIPDWKKAISESVRASSSYVIFHRTPVTKLSKTHTWTKSAYGVDMLEHAFSEKDLLGEFKKNKLKVVKITSQGDFAIEELGKTKIIMKSYLCKISK